ncbi:MAG: hypothetical protein NZ959_08460 [Armatimonadetes bacterium]|nr:hypothetical protein [Armatimonadota bacterium]MDW8122450.1 hypothetical protein [Armatimonadota bacterium]
MVKGWLERIGILLICCGLLFLCQPLTIALFKIGFPILLSGTILFIIAIHLPDRTSVRERSEKGWTG